MKVNSFVIDMLNARLAEEHSKFVQYKTHASMCANSGYKKLAACIDKRAEQEKEHAQDLIDRILFLEGFPLFDALAPVNIGAEIVGMFPLDRDSELAAIAGYTEGIDLTIVEKDFGTRKLLERILEEEEEHLNDIESVITQITNSGIENYLVVQINE